MRCNLHRGVRGRGCEDGRGAVDSAAAAPGRKGRLAKAHVRQCLMRLAEPAHLLQGGADGGAARPSLGPLLSWPRRAKVWEICN